VATAFATGGHRIVVAAACGHPATTLACGHPATTLACGHHMVASTGLHPAATTLAGGHHPVAALASGHHMASACAAPAHHRGFFFLEIHIYTITIEKIIYILLNNI